MAGKIVETLSIQVRNTDGNANSPFVENPRWSASLDQTGIGNPGGRTVTVGSTEEYLDLGDISTPGVLVLHNLDDTNEVHYRFETSTGTGTSSGNLGGRIVPGDFHKLQLNAGYTLAWKAVPATGTASVSVKVDVKHYEA